MTIAFHHGDKARKRNLQEANTVRVHQTDAFVSFVAVRSESGDLLRRENRRALGEFASNAILFESGNEATIGEVAELGANRAVIEVGGADRSVSSLGAVHKRLGVRRPLAVAVLVLSSDAVHFAHSRVDGGKSVLDDRRQNVVPAVLELGDVRGLFEFFARFARGRARDDALRVGELLERVVRGDVAVELGEEEGAGEWKVAGLEERVQGRKREGEGLLPVGAAANFARVALVLGRRVGEEQRFGIGEKVALE